jgi:hypothetical protein
LLSRQHPQQIREPLLDDVLLGLLGHVTIRSENCLRRAAGKSARSTPCWAVC